MAKFLTNVTEVGKVEYTVSTKKGQNTGIGFAMLFQDVTARLACRTITKGASGKVVALAAGAEQGKGLANTVQDAAKKSLSGLAEKVTPVRRRFAAT